MFGLNIGFDNYINTQEVYFCTFKLIKIYSCKQLFYAVCIPYKAVKEFTRCMPWLYTQTNQFIKKKLNYADLTCLYNCSDIYIVIQINHTQSLSW